MPKEYRVAGNERTYSSRQSADKTARMILADPPVEERDVSEWRTSPPESNVLAELRRLRALSADELEKELVVEFACDGNPYEMYTAVLFYLIGRHGSDAVRDAVCEMLGADKLPKKEK